MYQDHPVCDAADQKPVALYRLLDSNGDRPGDYAELRQALIGNWRRQRGRGNLPFLLVQLPNYGAPQPAPAESSRAALRQAQLQTLTVPYTAMAVAMDLGEWSDIHPLNKRDAGRQLALAA